MEWKPEQLCNPEGETLAGYYVSEDVKRLWNIELNLAKILLDVCKKHGLRISVAYGSMIGAVRHKGFVPWDDDMDFFMPREDYDKLNALADEEFNKKTGPVVLRSYEHDNHYYKLSLIRICLEGTAFFSKLQSMMGFEYDHSIAVDIFPVERLPDDEAAAEKLIKDYINLAQYMELRHYRRERLWKGRREFLSYRNYAAEKRNWSDDRIYGYLMDKFRDVPRKTQLCAHIQTYFRYEAIVVYKSFIDDEIIELPFERTVVPCYKSYDAILTRFFGDWRIPIHYPNDHEGYTGNTFIIDEHNSYKKYLKGSLYFCYQYFLHELENFIKIAVNLKHVLKLNLLLSRYRKKRVVLWGASIFLHRIILEGRVHDHNNIVGIVDRGLAQDGKKIAKFNVYGLPTLSDLRPDVVIITIVNHNKRFMPEIREYLQVKGLNPMLYVI